MSDLFTKLFDDKKSTVIKKKRGGNKKTNNTKISASDKKQTTPGTTQTSDSKESKKRKIPENPGNEPPVKKKIIINLPNDAESKKEELLVEDNAPPETSQPESDIDEDDWEDDGAGEAEYFEDDENNQEKESLLNEVKSFMNGTNMSQFTPEDEEEDVGNNKKRNMGGGKCSVLVGGILVGTPRREIRALFTQYGFGNIRDVRILFNKDNTKPTCCAFVDLPNLSFAKRAIDKIHGITFKGKKLDVKIVDNQTAPRGFSLYVKNLSFKTTAEKLKEVFSDCGEIIDVRIPVYEDTGKPKGQAWIEFKTAEARQTARQKDRVRVDGRQLLLSNANDKNFALL